MTNPTNEHREQAREFPQPCHYYQCCAQCCLNPQHEHYRKRPKTGGFTCTCCNREMELRVNEELCNECATGHASRDAEVREVLEGLRTGPNCWCPEDPQATGRVIYHDTACLATRALWEKVRGTVNENEEESDVVK